MAANNRNRYGNKNTARKPKQPGKILKYDGVTYRMVKRSDGRYNLYVEGRSGAVGSTPLVDAKDYAEAKKRIRELSQEFRDMEQSSQVNPNDNSVTTEEYEASTEDNVFPESQEVEPANDDTPVDVEVSTDDSKEAGSVKRGLAKVGVLAAKQRMKGLAIREKSGTKLMDASLKMVNNELNIIARAGGGPNILDKAVSSAVNKVGGDAKNNLREQKIAFEQEDKALRRDRFLATKHANDDAIREAKAAGYEKLEVEKAEIQTRINEANESKNPELIAKANMEMKVWQEKRRDYDKYIPEDVKLPYPTLPAHASKVRTAKERRRLDKAMNDWIVDENLTEAGRKKAAKKTAKSEKEKADTKRKIEKLQDAQESENKALS